MGLAYGRDPRDAWRRSPAWARVAWPTVSLHAGKMIPLHGIILPAFGRNGTEGSALRPRELDAVPPEPPLKFAHPVGAVAHVSDLFDPAGNRGAHAGALRAPGLSLAGHDALGGFGPSTPASPISPRGSFRIRPGAPEKYRARYRYGAGLFWFKGMPWFSLLQMKKAPVCRGSKRAPLSECVSGISRCGQRLDD